MLQTLKRRWMTMSRGRAGQRFQDHYASEKKHRNDASWGQRARRVFRLLLALVSITIAAVLMFLPGPAVLFYFIAGTLLASESLYVARFLDWMEVRLRKLWKWGKGHWGNTPTWGRVMLVTAVTALSAASTYLSYRLFRG